MANIHLDPGFDDDAFKEVIVRAMELEQSRMERLSEADLRSISREIGVSVESITRAIEERRSAVEPVSNPPTRESHISWPIHLGALGVGLATAYYSGTSTMMLEGDQTRVGLVAVSVLQVVGVLLAAFYRGPAKHERFQLSNLLLWSGLGLGWRYLQVHAPHASSELALVSGLACAVAGAAAIALLDKFRRPEMILGARPPRDGSSRWQREVKPLEMIRSWMNVFKRDRAVVEVVSPTSKPNYV